MRTNNCILAIDDDRAFLGLIQATLESEGIDVLTTNDPIHGIGLACTRRPSIILTDYSMPQMNGFQVMERIQEFDPEASVIVMTGQYSPERAAEALQKGARDYISKPVLVTVLRQRIRRLTEETNFQKVWPFSTTDAVSVLQEGYI